MPLCVRRQPLCACFAAAALAAAGLVRQASGALNLSPEPVERDVLQMRGGIFIADGLVEAAASRQCSSTTDGPHCAELSGSEAEAVTGASLVDGMLSTSLFGGAGSGDSETLDEIFFRGSMLADAVDSASPVGQGKGMQEAEQEKPTMRSRRRRLGCGRSVLLTLRELEPWRRTSPPPTFARSRLRGFPFAVHWEGPWELATTTVEDNAVSRRGRFVAQLRGAYGSLRFGRPVHVQGIDVARPAFADCLNPVASAPDLRSRGPLPEQPPPPMVVRGRRAGMDIFSELVAPWEMPTHVNVVEFSALTSMETVDEVIFLAAECIEVAAIQATFGCEPEGEQARSHGHGYLLTLRDGWKAYGWEEIDFHPIALKLDGNGGGSTGAAPAWSLDDVIRLRMKARRGTFEEPRQAALQEDSGSFARSVGPERFVFPEGLEEVVDLTPRPTAAASMASTAERNVTLLRDLVHVLHAEGTAVASGSHAPARGMLRGLLADDVHADLVRLLEGLAESAEGGSIAVLAAATGGGAFDLVWRRLGLHALDSLALRVLFAEAIPGGALAKVARQSISTDAAGEAVGEARNTAANLSHRPGGEVGIQNDGYMAHSLQSILHAAVAASNVLSRRVERKNQRLVPGLPGGYAAVQLDPSLTEVSVVVGDNRGRSVAAHVTLADTSVIDDLFDDLDPRSGSAPPLGPGQNVGTDATAVLGAAMEAAIAQLAAFP